MDQQSAIDLIRAILHPNTAALGRFSTVTVNVKTT